MLGFLTFLIIAGGLATLVALADPRHARIAPYLGFVFLFAGLFALVLSFGLALPGTLLRSDRMSGLGFFAGYAIGGLAGAVFGFTKAVKRRKGLESNGSS